MTEAELTAHLQAALKAIPETSVSAIQAAYSALAEIERMRKELERLQELERNVRFSLNMLDVERHVVAVPVVAAAQPSAPASPPRLHVVRSGE